MGVVEHHRRRGRTRISTNNQATIPVAALRRAGLKPGDELRVEAAGAGRIVLSRVEETLAAYVGRLTGIYGPAQSKRPYSALFPSRIQLRPQSRIRLRFPVQTTTSGVIQ